MIHLEVRVFQFCLVSSLVKVEIFIHQESFVPAMSSHALPQGFVLFFWAFLTKLMKSDLSYWLLIPPFYVDHAGMMTSTKGPRNLCFKY